ncbi:acetamidase regulatory protein, putative [Talaromyces stipitatus ATCC 10500]|uniref:Acetamidase regulatory protein, putative n=1 Tax=Talaromyces stipitatus (strain ATCC 10500 / CBS 375.48 / QM 6759 / NRRL 1006) TaxID=441959 RepID=B8MAL7_TALSN|nr:acetamidase regulatory protein, putative [Talaromyces stipitatus ATCC 10500]EED17441.1 acetamidase regulatory protein, putative [Talaromyces stipitatus ATCC 10500]
MQKHRILSRRQQMHSCDNCRRRKIRCDSVQESPCSACTKSEVDCKFTVGWRRRKRPRTPASVSSREDVDSTLQTPDGIAINVSLSDTSLITNVSPQVSLQSNDDEQRNETNSRLPETEIVASLNLAENGLYHFFRDGIPSSSWNVFDPMDKIRVAYVGTHLSNMSHLVSLNRPRPQFLIYPYPQIHPPLSWKPDISHTTNHDIMHDITSFPAKDIRDDFVEAYFEKINPYFPVVNECEFRARYRDVDNQPPLLLLHAVLLAGAHVSGHPKAMQARHVVKAVIFRRAKYVFDMRHENDRMHLVQAALLFTWHLQNGDTASSNSYFWLGVACRIAFGIGMHRNQLNDPPNPGRMPISDRRLWRRVWWTLFQVEIMSALEHGRPSMIRVDDFDQEPLSPEDFVPENGTVDSNIDYDYCARNIALCHIALELIELSAPRVSPASRQSRMASINAQLVSWMLSLPTNNTESFGALNLRLLYNTVVMHFCRMITPECGSPLQQIDGTEKISLGARNSIITSLETLQGKGMLSQCHFTAVTAITAAAIQVAKDIQQALEGNQAMIAVNDIHLLDTVCSVAEQLSKYWPSAESVMKLFRSLSQQFTTALNGMRDGYRYTRSEDLVDFQLANVNWTDIFGSSWPMDHLYTTEQEWDVTMVQSE